MEVENAAEESSEEGMQEGRSAATSCLRVMFLKYDNDYDAILRRDGAFQILCIKFFSRVKLTGSLPSWHP